MLEDLVILGFKEIYVRTLTNHYVNQRFSVATHDKEYKLY